MALPQPVRWLQTALLYNCNEFLVSYICRIPWASSWQPIAGWRLCNASLLNAVSCNDVISSLCKVAISVDVWDVGKA